MRRLHAMASLFLCLPGLSGAADALVAERLPQRGARPQGAPLFSTLEPGTTGIHVENNFADPEMWGKRYQELTYGAIGTGVAIADYDNDGRPDVFVVSKTEQSRLFRNLGGWKFEDVTEKAGLAGSSSWLSKGVATVSGWFGSPSDDPAAPETWRQGASFVDVNNDGWVDLYLCRFGAPNLLYINQGDGTFSEEAAERGLALVDASTAGAFCDYDRDGWLDVYVQTNMFDAEKHPHGQRDYLFRNKGNGTFENVTERAGISGETAGHSATWWDYDEDGWPDLYVANDYGVPDSLYRNNRDGTFSNVIHSVVPHMPYYAMGSDAADVNNDGRIDFLVADMAATSHTKSQRGMAGSRARAQAYPDDPDHAPQYMRNMLYLNTGTGKMKEAALLAGIEASDWTWTVRLEDLDEDGRVDLLLTNGMNREYHNLDVLARNMAVENPEEARKQIKASPVLAEANLAFRNLGDLRFEPVGAAWGLDEVGVSFGTAFGDLDSDGDLDLVYGNYEKGPTVLRNDSHEGHRLLVSLRGTRSNRFGVGARVEIVTAVGKQVRELTLTRGYLSTSEPLLHFGLGAETQVSELTVRWPSGHLQHFRDVAADQRLVITEPDSVSPVAEARSPKREGLFVERAGEVGLDLKVVDGSVKPSDRQVLLRRTFDRLGPALVAADLNRDHRQDMVFGGTAEIPTRVVMASPSGGFHAPQLLPVPSGPRIDDGPILALDFDADGDLDLLVTRMGEEPLEKAGAAYQPVLLINDGAGRFRLGPTDALPQLAIAAGAASAADINADGFPDVFIGARLRPGQYPVIPESVLLLNDGKGRLVDVTDRWAPGLRTVGLVTSALWTDVDADGRPDLLVSTEWGGVRLWRNEVGERLVDRSESLGFTAAGKGWWTSLASGDFNGDGRMDYVAGNVGLNTPYRATTAEPALAFLGNFGSNNRPVLVEAVHEDGELYPASTRGELAVAIPALVRRYASNDDFARTPLAELLGEAKLRAAQRWEATEFRSGVFLSRADGGFEFRPLPTAAQLAPIQGMCVLDVNADGHADLLITQNSHAAVQSVGRFAGGLGECLLGDGKGGFAAAPTAETGWLVPGDAKSLVPIDFSGDPWPALLVSRNGAPALLFQRSGTRQGTGLAVRFGERAASGPLRVELQCASGRVLVQELNAGSGYWSQGTTCYFAVPAGEQPERVTVGWPGGRKTVHEVRSAELFIAAP